MRVRRGTHTDYSENVGHVPLTLADDHQIHHTGGLNAIGEWRQMNLRFEPSLKCRRFKGSLRVGLRQGPVFGHLRLLSLGCLAMSAPHALSDGARREARLKQ